MDLGRPRYSEFARIDYERIVRRGNDEGKTERVAEAVRPEQIWVVTSG
jgi:hypothetical protein